MRSPLMRGAGLCLRAMPPRDYHERLWEGIPEGLEPESFAERLEFVLAHVTAGERLLDVGCGEGVFATALVEQGLSVVGIDVACEPLRRARAAVDGLELHLVDDQSAWPLPDASFDVAWAGEVIEHVADTAGWQSEIRRVLRPGGWLLLSTPGHSRLRVLGLALRRGAFEAHFDPRSDHLRFYTRNTLTTLLADFGFEQVVVSGAGGLPGARPVLLCSARRKRW
jgi:2-polyprenyl-6-hydroxyphenyl methylase/3-demethylubiquinone-9 3-methyltransferase